MKSEGRTEEQGDEDGVSRTRTRLSGSGVREFKVRMFKVQGNSLTGRMGMKNEIRRPHPGEVYAADVLPFSLRLRNPPHRAAIPTAAAVISTPASSAIVA